MSSLQPNLWAAEYVTFPAATIFLILRLASRRITRIHLWWDDYFAILCYVTAVAWAVMLPIWMRHGFGLHAEDVQGMTIEEANYTTKKYLFIIEHLYAFTLFFAKISILSFYWRMFRVANIQIAISILLTCSILWIIVRIFLTTFHCYPVEAFWNPHIEHFVCPIKSADFFFGTVLAHVIIDVENSNYLFVLIRYLGVRSWSRYRYRIYPLQQQVTRHDISTGSRHNMGFSGGKPGDNIHLSSDHSTSLPIYDDLHGPNHNVRFRIQRVPPKLSPKPNEALDTSFKDTQC
ncbi:hypothetical protein FPSE5266_04710 [Fusarium pseudograminearum]|nr:hypothetical protein FPSE5266_04710 [Fusarium pseudograminearum]